ncbi:hypothetical protein AVEN_2543-1 [Araneus ventricosus]|uniref:Uncharacterized protein n=1 Tax=Araneus ventricosus TaxID=182803 RepID=A0A4Y2QHU5_ARAVE|nr:hypothetical protein AVEN_2543-1 [Araneus ventricosus]
MHGGSSVESGLEPGALRPQSRDLTTRPPRPVAALSQRQAPVEFFYRHSGRHLYVANGFNKNLIMYPIGNRNWSFSLIIKILEDKILCVA